MEKRVPDPEYDRASKAGTRVKPDLIIILEDLEKALSGKVIVRVCVSNFNRDQLQDQLEDPL